MKSTLSSLFVVILSLGLLMTSSTLASTAKTDIKRSVSEFQQNSPHMQIADRLLKRVMDITYETLQDLGATREDLERVQQKRSYIQACYFQAISCY